ncbi:hypothetical protein HYH03_012003 [Edaphochlamys debaryana]|uniref:F-box domain-containing protein n=1 Tax=Edaphochlamys debaryana TaxID=47281 RepID=A0A836BV04_9CHLO|nr:hypothetical protein HYH03_012003 [Edaphochlamys debaryana]|eukprot:KAG2489552.1 hypothetical protein HYH03_012003 [Edaphochlamys debaryana]
MAAAALAALPAALGTWIVLANLSNGDQAGRVVLPSALQALVDSVRGLRSRRRHAQRRRLAGSLAPLTLERDFLFGTLPPNVTSSVIGRLDPASRKALRATCRRARLCVSGFNSKLLLDGRGLKRFSVAPLHVLFPYLREIHVAPPYGTGLSASQAAGLAAAGRSGSAAGGGGGVLPAGGSSTGPAVLLGLLDSGALSFLPYLDLLDLSRWRRPACPFSRRDWKALVDALPDPDAAQRAQHTQHAAPYRAGAAGGYGGGGGGRGRVPGLGLRLRVDWRVLPLRSIWPPPSQLPDWQEVAWAVKWLAKRRPQVRLELEGPPLPLPSPGTLAALRTPADVAGGGLRTLSAGVAPPPAWARHRFDSLSSLRGLHRLTLRLAGDQGAGTVLTALRDLPYLEYLALPGSTLWDADMPALSQLGAVKTLLVAGLVLRGPQGPAAQPAGADPAQPQPQQQPQQPAAAAGAGAARPSLLAPPRVVVSGLERLVVASRLEVAPALGLLPSMPALSALGVTAKALAQPLPLLPQAPAPPPPPAAAPPAAAAAAAPPPLLQELVQHQLAMAAGGGGGLAAAGAAPAPMHSVWAAPPPARSSVGGTGGTSSLPHVSLREVSVMYGPRRAAGTSMSPAAAEAAAAAAAAEAAAEPAVAALLAAAAALPTMQKVRLWRPYSPEHVLRLLRPVAEEMPLPLVLLELHDVGPPEAHPVPGAGRRSGPAGLGGRSWLPHRGGPGQAQGGFQAADGDEEEDEEEDDDEEGEDEEGEDEEEDEEGEEGETAAAVEEVAAAAPSASVDAGPVGIASGSGDGATAARVGGGGALDDPALLTSLLTSRRWAGSSQRMAALALGCSRTLVMAGGDALTVRALTAVGLAAAAGGGGGGHGVAVQRLVLKRTAGLDERALAGLARGLRGLQALWLQGCPGVGVPEVLAARSAAGARGLAVAWTAEG